jgi:hypothetical protein
MAGIVITTIEQLKSTEKFRWHPTVIIEGELANNLMISGVVRALHNGESQEAEVVSVKETDSVIYPVVEILKDLSTWNRFEILEGEKGKRIKIYPKTAVRREGN